MLRTRSEDSIKLIPFVSFNFFKYLLFVSLFRFLANNCFLFPIFQFQIYLYSFYLYPYSFRMYLYWYYDGSVVRLVIETYSCMHSFKKIKLTYQSIWFTLKYWCDINLKIGVCVSVNVVIISSFLRNFCITGASQAFFFSLLDIQTLILFCDLRLRSHILHNL